MKKEIGKFGKEMASKNQNEKNYNVNVLERIEQMYENWDESFTWNELISSEEWEKIEEYQIRMGLR